MKKLISSFLAAVMLLTSVTAFADNKDSAEMKEALAAVKQKITVPEEFTEFNFERSERDGKVTYGFDWSDEHDRYGIAVACDDKGQISHVYASYKNEDRPSKLASFTDEQKFEFADNAIKTAVPEIFAGEDDTYVRSEQADMSDSDCYIFYNRQKNGVEVLNNDATVVLTTVEGKLAASTIRVDVDSDAEFEAGDSQISDPAAAYDKVFPLEMVYRDKYTSCVRKKSEKETVLFYRVKDDAPGYISAKTGEAVEEDIGDYDMYESAVGGNNQKSDLAAADRGAEALYDFTDKELKELETAKNLISKEDAEKILRSVPCITVPSNASVGTYLTSRDDEYFRDINISKDSDNSSKDIRATLNAKTGKLLSLSNYTYNRGDSSKKADANYEKKAKAAVDKFLNAVAAEDLKNCLLADENVDEYAYSRRYDLIVNGIRYLSDGIYVTYAPDENEISRYNLDMSKDMEFADVNDAISLDEAKKIWYEKVKTELIYVPSGGEYKLCYGPSEIYVRLDALTGKFMNNDYLSDSYEYDDIDGHWAREAIEWLSDDGIGFDSDKFYPDAPISQADFLRLVKSVLDYSQFMNYDDEDLYRFILYVDVEYAERNPNAQVTREDAFKYFTRLAGYRTLGANPSVFNVKYADAGNISPSKTGYCSILTGLGVIGGNGTYVYPKRPITRGETAMLLYKYSKTLFRY